MTTLAKVMGIELAKGKSIATGDYTGDNTTTGRQITTAFKCSMVIIVELETLHFFLVIPSRTLEVKDGSDTFLDRTANAYPHATDGFVVGDTVAIANVDTNTYNYWAISE